LALKVLRRLLASNLQEGVAAVDEVVSSARALKDTRTAMRSMSMLAEVNDPVTERALRAYTHAEAQLVRLHAAKLLERRGDKAPLASIISELTAQLQASDDRQKLQTLALLQLAGEPASAPKILPLLQDDSSAIRREAVITLSRFDDDSLHAALTPLLEDPDPRVQAAAARALQRAP
jgi:HEAT repeat protein